MDKTKIAEQCLVCLNVVRLSKRLQMFLIFFKKQDDEIKTMGHFQTQRLVIFC